MKKLFTLLAMVTGIAVLTPQDTQARDYRPSGGRSFWHNCNVCGDPMYREKVYVGRDRFGHPIYDWRTVPHQHQFRRGRGHDHDHHHHGPSRGPGIFIPLPGIRR